VHPATDTSRGRFTARIVSVSLDSYTPIMLSTHIYWNIGAFQSPTILNTTLQLPYANRIISLDSLLIPTGELQSVVHPWQSPSVPLNFTAPKQIWEGALSSQQCGYGCTGIDNAFILDRPATSSPESMESVQLKWYAPDTGITMSVKTNQQSLQIYACVGQNGTVIGHGGVPVEKYGCLVIEPQQWIDGINHPEWGQEERQIFGPDSLPSVNFASYDFEA
jgi:aldose 1-epimerase